MTKNQVSHRSNRFKLEREEEQKTIQRMIQDSIALKDGESKRNLLLKAHLRMASIREEK